jgi:RND family efflux transporter MFP subunit
MEQNPSPENFQAPRKKNPLEKLLSLLKKTASAGSGLAQDTNLRVKITAPAMNVIQALESKIPPQAKSYYTLYHGRWIVLGLMAFILFSMVKGCLGGAKGERTALTELVGQTKQKEEGPVPVKGFKVGRFNFEDSLNALGTIKGAVEFKLSFEVPGTVSSINYREGERYEEGALLISLKQDDILLRLKRAQAELNKYQAQGSITEEKVKDHEKLFAMGAITKSALESAKLEMESAQYESEAARLEVKAAESMLEKSNLYAPSAGMIGELNIEEGESVTQNTLLGTHVNVEFVFAEFGVVERDVNKIALGQKARVFVDAFPDKTFEGVIENVAPVVAGTSRTATARVRIENPDRLLLPGMFARIRILLYSKKNTLVVPTDSIQGPQGEQFVYVVHSENKAETQGDAAVVAAEGEKQPAPKDKKKKGLELPKLKAEDKTPDTVEKRAITVGYNRPDYSQVDAGISEGEVVAVSGLERLEDGKKVRLLEIQEAEV